MTHKALQILSHFYPFPTASLTALLTSLPSLTLLQAHWPPWQGHCNGSSLYLGHSWPRYSITFSLRLPRPLFSIAIPSPCILYLLTCFISAHSMYCHVIYYRFLLTPCLPLFSLKSQHYEGKDFYVLFTLMSLESKTMPGT